MQNEPTSDSIAGQTIGSGDIHKLAKLLELGSGSSPQEVWREDELQSVLRHQLDSGLDELDASDAQATLAAEPFDGSLRVLLSSESSSLEMLKSAKDHFKRLGAQRDALPSSVVAACYLACICAALVRHSQRISSSQDADLLTNLSWAQSQPWMDKSLLELFASAEQKIRSGAA